MASSRAVFSRTASRARTTAGACPGFLQSSMLRTWRRLFWRSYPRARAPRSLRTRSLFGLERRDLGLATVLLQSAAVGVGHDRRVRPAADAQQANPHTHAGVLDGGVAVRPFEDSLDDLSGQGWIPSGRIEAVDPPRRGTPAERLQLRVQLAVADARSGDHSAGPRGMARATPRHRGRKPRPRGSRQPAGFASCRAGRVHSPPTGARTEAAPGHRAALSGQPATTSDTLVTCRLLTGEGRPKIEDRPGGSARRAARRARACLPETLAGPYGPFRDGVLAGRRAPGAAITPALPVNTRSKHTPPDAARRCQHRAVRRRSDAAHKHTPGAGQHAGRDNQLRHGQPARLAVEPLVEPAHQARARDRPQRTGSGDHGRRRRLHATKPGMTVACTYVGYLPDGRVFDARRTAAARALRFRLDRNEVIEASTRRRRAARRASASRCAWVRPAYGDRGFPHLVPPKTALVFDLERPAAARVPGVNPGRAPRPASSTARRFSGSVSASGGAPAAPSPAGPPGRPRRPRRARPRPSLGLCRRPPRRAAPPRRSRPAAGSPPRRVSSFRRCSWKTLASIVPAGATNL